MSQYEQGNINPSDFSKPSKMVEGIGFGRFALAKRSLRISNRPEPEQIKNPVLEFDESQELVLGVGESKEITFSYEIRSQFAEAVYLSGYSSAGYIQEGPPRGFGEDEFVMEGTLSMQWIAQENPENGTMYVILEDDKGGVDFWSAPAAVQ